VITLPFKSIKQERFLFMNPDTRQMATEWRKNYGDAPGWPGKKKSKRGKRKVKKTSESIITLLKLAEILDKEQQYVASDKLTKIAYQILAHCGHCSESPMEANCGQCKASAPKPMTCISCGWGEAKMCEACSMKKFGGKCPDCGGDITSISESYDSTLVQEAKTLSYKEKQAAPCVFPKGSSNVNDNKDHFPIPDLSHGSNALARSEQYSSVPPWYNGTLEGLQSAVKSAVYKKFPGLKSRKEKREE
jgi:hypothetical protein